ncbi:hypothetical protein [Pseudomonas syringae]|uniref:hypothetical protein n=1 Tax=Pseudomonas syringae TaxID=317 RepID=UPI001E442E38|nr:hypothetical protein [Pseudomonas syringae]
MNLSQGKKPSRYPSRHNNEETNPLDPVFEPLFYAIKIRYRKFFIEFLDAFEVILIRMSADEASHTFGFRYLLELGDNLIGIPSIQITINHGEVVTTMKNIEHIAITNGQAFYRRHFASLHDYN